MTCIVAIKDKDTGTVWMGGDGVASDPTSHMPRVTPKVFKNEEALIGYSASYRLGDIVQYHFTTPEDPRDAYDHRYMCSIFVPFLSNVLSEQGYDWTAEEEGELLVAIRDRIFVIQHDLHVGEYTYDYYAIGSGQDYAMGSLATMDIVSPGLKVSAKLATEDKVLTALEVASFFSGTVGPPFTILST